MPAFRAKGSTGPAPTTVFLGPIPDRFSIARAQHYVSSSNKIVIDSFAPTNYINSWTPFNTFLDTNADTNAATIALDATTVAPDGTSSGNAQKIVEAANTGVHASVVGFPSAGVMQYGGWSMRVAAFAKAAERTRIWLAITTNTNSVNIIDPLAFGCRTVFDLAGVQIGVANTAFNLLALPSPVPGPATIQSFGNGWCLCMMDVFFPFGQNMSSGTWCAFGLDSGSGVGAASTSYAGDASGVYAWRSSVLPPSAWSMGGSTTFFSGFDSINEIDVNNTKAAGFKWYTNNNFPGGGFNGNFHPEVIPTPSNEISVSGSVLTLQQTPDRQLQTQLMSAASIGSNTDLGIVGNAFLPPFLFETKVSFDNVIRGAEPFITWCAAQGTLGIGKYAFRGIEIDFANMNNVYNLGGALFTWIANGTDNNGLQGPFFNWNSMAGYTGYQAWDSVTNYNANEDDVASKGGVAYAANTRPPTNNINNPPPNAGFWDVIPTPTTNVTSYNFIDFTTNNIYNTLILPTPFNDTGWIINFMNGTPCGSTPGTALSGPIMAYSPLISGLGNDGGGYIQSWTADPIILILFAGAGGAGFGNGNPAKFDYVSVVQ